ncbi:MAG: hypothetical protein GC171_11620 [Terrimonas sp.]|nr:hypothetical protein [Terrimonas sp.]
MKRTIVAATAIIALFVFPSCEKVVGKGPVETETRNLSNFTGVSSAFSGKVHIRIEPVFKVEASAQRNVLDVLRTNVSNGILYIDYKDNTWVRTREDVIVSISMPMADYLRLSGSGNMDVIGENSVNSLDMQVSGSGSITLQKALVAGNLDARISGSGNMTIYDGSTNHEKLQISGSGGMNFADILATSAETHTSGSGDMKVNVAQQLEAHISGSGSVLYKGTPQVSASISGSGKVKPY